MWVSSSAKRARRQWIWLILLLTLKVVHGAEETAAEDTTPQDSYTSQNNSNNNSTNNDCDCDCDYVVRCITCPFNHAEEPHYDKQNDILIFVDAYLGKVCIYDPNTGCTSSSCELDEPLGSVIPLLDSCNEYIIGYGPKVAKMRWDGCCDSCPEITILSRHDKEKRGIVFNDGKADLFGRPFMNTKGPLGPDGETESGYATLYRYSKKKCGLQDALGRDDKGDIFNGIAWNCNYTKMYMCDTKKKKIYCFDYDLKTGDASNKKTVFDYNKENEDGAPDGMTIDCCGKLWVASLGGWNVIQVDPDKSKVLRRIKIPARDVTSCIFGGCGRDDILYVTTSRRNLTPEEKKEQPQAGSVFAVYNLCVQGLPCNDACICRGGCFCSGFYDPCYGCTSCGKDDKDDDDKDNKNDGDGQDENSNNDGSESNNNDSNNSGNNTTNCNSNSCRSCGYGGKYGFRTASSGDYERCRGCCEVCGGVGYRFGACYGGGSCGGGKSGGCNNGYGSCGCSKSGGCNNGYGSCGCSKSCGCNNGYGSCGCCKSCGSGNGYGSCGCCNSGGFNSYGLCDCGKSCGSSCGSSKGYSSCCCCKSYVTEKDSGTSTNNTSDGSSDGTNGSGSGCSCGGGASGSFGRSGFGSCGGNGGDGYGCGGFGRGGYTSCVGGGSCSCYGLCGPCGSCGSCGGSGSGGRCGSCGGSGCGGCCGSCGGSGCGGRCGSCGCGSSGNFCPSGSSGPPRGSCGCCSRGPYGSGRAGYVPGACGSCRRNGGCDNLVEGLLSVLAAKKNY